MLIMPLMCEFKFIKQTSGNYLRFKTAAIEAGRIGRMRNGEGRMRLTVTTATACRNDSWLLLLAADPTNERTIIRIPTSLVVGCLQRFLRHKPESLTGMIMAKVYI